MIYPTYLQPQVVQNSQTRHYVADVESPEFWDTVDCRQAGCRHYEEGFKSRVPYPSDMYDLIKHKSGRVFTETVQMIDPETDLPPAFIELAGDNAVKDEFPMMATFLFPAGQKCFSEHEGRNGRDPKLYVAGRGNLQYIDGDQWCYRFNEDIFRASQMAQRG